ncbi:hypothetical protein [Mucilaginibacter paludis]|uniref:Uncharacterized protein n=1 Tax=Mucilaginibacter paludis DSM 18603 TaxID=714943 RepID=H1YID0_9SPHI|nr:hypothetical protein [Mucilaginibacter paludis]EHQ27543.1 hypothetical protein Mucpa_3444 [Mucilaginibacter paludis DSM 18603]
MKYDVRPFLKIKMPGLLDLLGTQNISWKTINKNFGKKLQRIKDELTLTQKPIFKEATFYSVLMSKHYKTGEGDGMFDWYSTLFQSLSSNLNPVEKALIHHSIYNLLIEPDKNYLNFIGELAVLNEIKKQEGYDLINIEEQIQKENNTTADFLILRKHDDTNILVEVVNLHFQEIDIDDHERIRRLIESKLNNKIKMKFINPLYEYFLQPVIWVKGENDVEQLFNLYDKSGLPIKNVLAPFTYFSYWETSGKYEHHFDRIY